MFALIHIMVNILWGQEALLSSQSSLIYIGFGAPMRLLRIHAVLLNRECRDT